MNFVKRLRASTLRLVALVVVLAAAVVMIVLPSLSPKASSRSARQVDAEFSAIDPRAFAPQPIDLPNGTQLNSSSYISTLEAAKRNGTSLAVLQGTGREIGFSRDFQVPRYGDIEVEVVRFRTSSGLARAYKYFLTLPSRQNLRAVPFEGIGERAAMVVSPEAAFVEFVRGRYYVVVTSVPMSGTNLNLIGHISKQVDDRIRSYHQNA